MINIFLQSAIKRVSYQNQDQFDEAIVEIITKQDAINRGLNYYFTGKPCLNGHIAKRLLSSPHCAICKLEKRKKFYQENIDKEQKRGREYYAKNRDRNLSKMLEWQKNNKESVYKRNKLWREANKDKCKKSNATWRSNNKAYILFKNTLRKKTISLATPKWANLLKIKHIYRKCFDICCETGVIHHVDHIIPLQGKNVCGLHVENNLQIITASENLKKSNILFNQGE